MVKALEVEAARFVKEEQGRIIVDWQGLAKEKRRMIIEGDGSRSWAPLFDSVLQYLLGREVLTFSRENTYRIVSLGSDFGPKTSYGQDRMNFTRQEDAEDYLREFHKDTIYSVAVERLAA